jgi:hypothetical protein
MPKWDAFAQALVQAVTLIVAAATALPTLAKDVWAPASGPPPSHIQEARDETFQAIAISRLAARSCGGAYAFNDEKAVNALKFLQVKSLADIPASVEDKFLLAFERNPAGACKLAYHLYVIGEGSAPPFNQFLRPNGGPPR